jgi:hypothetical protein
MRGHVPGQVDDGSEPPSSGSWLILAGLEGVAISMIAKKELIGAA